MSSIENTNETTDNQLQYHGQRISQLEQKMA